MSLGFVIPGPVFADLFGSKGDSMAYKIINEQDWQKYFDSLSRQFGKGRHIELTVAGSDLGAQTEEGNAEFAGISYDPREQVVHVYTDLLDHAILQPREVVAVEEGETLKALSIRNAEGQVQSIRFQ
jgi:hypothetical protein